MISSQITLYALIGGIIPALVWLHFWLREDHEHPEPRGRIIYTFLLGGLSVAVVIPIEQFIHESFGLEIGALIPFLLWAATEEIGKYVAAYWSALRTRFFDEPVDAVVYMMTAALGFSAVENTFFILQPLLAGDHIQTVVTGNLRFIGASLLHLAASAIVGICISFAFYKSRATKIGFTLLGLALAIILHTLFNFFIIANESKYILIVFGSIWTAVILLIFLIERIKIIKKQQPPTLNNL
jgi:protease PrsW